MSIQDNPFIPQGVDPKKRYTFSTVQRLAGEKNCTIRKNIGGESTVYGYFVDLPNGSVESFGKLRMVAEFLAQLNVEG